MKKIITLFFALTCMILISGCSDEEGADPTPDNNLTMEFANCRITQTDRQNFASHFYTYNDKKQLVTFSAGISSSEYSYSPGKVIIKTYYDGELQKTENVDVNGNGFGTRVEAVFENGVTPKRVTDFLYNDKSQLIKKTEKNEGSVNEKVTVYQWQNGNMVSESKPDLSGMTEYTYTTDLTQPAEWFNELDRGYATIITKNRVKTIKHAHITYTHSYGEDANGLITSITVTNSDGGSYTMKYTYACD